ncbi:Type I restriction enzyme MjaVII specificity subunit [Sulfurospirillum sp. 'SP']|nr:restriction endonuclease subunit S [Sulfurospirillum sp. 'SP']WNY99958.1 Type I restriction enzyme MjaVII specificity subunit [Sulfurospirillum sp. 'SP']
MNAIKQGYKQTKVGIIPEDWEVVKLGDICKFQQGVQVDLELQKNYPIDGYVKFLRIENYTQNSNDFRYIPINLSQNKTIAENEIAIVRYGATAGYIARGYNGVLANNLFKLIPNLKFIKNEFLYFCLTSQKVFNFFQSEMAGGAMPALSFGIVEVLKLYLPPLKQQEKIAEILTTWDEAISLHVKLIEEKEQLKIGLMQKLLSGEVRFSGFCDEWKKVKLGDICNITTGTSKSQFIGEGDYYVIDMGSVSSTGNLIASKKTALQKDLLQKGDLIMPKDDIGGGQIIGKVALIEEDNKYILGDHVFKIVTKQNSRFLLYKINSFEVNNNLKRKVTGSAQLGLNKKNVEDLQIYLPSLPEQQRIAEVLSFADDALNLLKKELEELKQQKKGLMQKLLTGEVRVNV